MDKCRVCGNKLFPDPLIVYNNMPGSAQYMPTQENLAFDKKISLNVRQCMGCGLIQLDNEPVNYYKEVIRATSVSKAMNEMRRKEFASFINRYNLHNKKVIEIACGKGEALEIMNEQMIDARGIEYGQESVTICNTKGLKVDRVYIDSETKKIEGAPFDAFYVLNYLEHVPDPNQFIQGIYNNLTDEAVGIIEVPNFDMIIKENLFSEFIIDHLSYFTYETLSFLLNKNGFDIIDTESIWDEYIISVVVRKRKKLDIAPFIKACDNLVDQVNEYINRFPNDKIAVWGAGHQALTVLALSNVSGKIKYVIDSAKFKQGKFTQATHIPIVGPEVLKSDPIEAVLVMGAGYTDEIAAIILNEYPDMKVAVLNKTRIEERR